MNSTLKAKTFTLFCSLLFFTLLPSANSLAAGNGSLGPLSGRNQVPILNLFYIMQATDASSLGEGHREFRFDFDVSNIQERQGGTFSSLIYDMELYRPSFHFSYGILDNVDIHMEIPALGFSGGRLDRITHDFHNIFSLPNGNRAETPNGLFGYSYSRDGETIFDFPSRDLSLSDINLDIKWVVFGDDSWLPSIALRSGIEFPTGNFDYGTGSGGYDYTFGAAFGKSVSRLNFFGGIEMVIIGVPDKLSALINEDVTHYYIGAEFVAIKDHFSLIVQVDGQNTPFAETGKLAIDRDVMEVTSGFKGSHYNNRLIWQLALREDIIHHSTVDYTISLNIGSRF